MLRAKYAAKGALARVVPRRRLMWCRRSQACRSVALTFDDGPHPTVTARLLDLLDGLGVKATFFVLGTRVSEQAHLVKRIHEAGHEIGSHGFSHVSMRSMTDAEVITNLARCDAAIAAAGAAVPALFRPPYGEYRLRQLPLLWGLNKTVALWSIDSRDFEASSPDSVMASVPVHRLRGGDIVLFHDQFAHTVEAVGELVQRIRRRGLGLGTIGAMIGDSPRDGTR